MLPEDVPAALSVVTRRLTRPPPEGTAFEDLKARALRHAEEQDASAEGKLLARALVELFPPDSAAARPPWSDAAHLAPLTAAAFARYWTREITPDRLRLAVAGEVSASAIRAGLERAFPRERVAASSPRAVLPPRGADSWREVRIAVPDLLQDEFLVVWPGDRSRPSDGAATEALLYLLGETGYAGRLGDALVDPGLVYSVEASLEGEGASSWLAVRTACDTKDAPEVLSRIRKTLEEAALGKFTEAERLEALAYLRGRAARHRDGSANVAEALLRDATSPSREGALTLGALNDAARRLFTRGYPIALVAEKAEEK